MLYMGCGIAKGTG